MHLPAFFQFQCFYCCTWRKRATPSVVLVQLYQSIHTRTQRLHVLSCHVNRPSAIGYPPPRAVWWNKDKCDCLQGLKSISVCVYYLLLTVHFCHGAFVSPPPLSVLHSSLPRLLSEHNPTSYYLLGGLKYKKGQKNQRGLTGKQWQEGVLGSTVCVCVTCDILYQHIFPWS